MEETCRLKVKRSVPVLRSHTRSVLSSESEQAIFLLGSRTTLRTKYGRDVRTRSSSMLQKKEQTFISVAGQDPLAFSTNDIPDTDAPVIAPRDKCSSSSGESKNKVLVSLQMQFVVWVLVHAYLYKYGVS